MFDTVSLTGEILRVAQDGRDGLFFIFSFTKPTLCGMIYYKYLCLEEGIHVHSETP